VPRHRLALGLEPKAGTALADGRHALLAIRR